MDLPELFFRKEPMTAEGFTTLHLGAVQGHTACVAVLLGAGVPDPDCRAYQATARMEWFGVTAIHLAVIHGHVATTQLLLDDALVSPNLQCTIVDDEGETIEGTTALHLAAHHGHPEIARLLLGHDSYEAVNLRTTCDKSALHIAALQGHRAVVESVFESDRFVPPLLHEAPGIITAAAEAGHRCVVAFLLDHLADQRHVADVLYVDGLIGRPALLGAVCNGHNAVVDTLLRFGRLFPDLFPIAGDTSWDRLQISEAEVGEDVTPLHMAVGHAGVLRVLLETQHFPVHSRCRVLLHGVTPVLQANVLHLACWLGHTASVRVLLSSPHFPDGQINARCDYGRTALHVAVRCAHLGTVRMLLRSPRFVEQNAVEDTAGATALHSAIFFGGHYMIVRALLDSANFTARDATNNRHHTALELALLRNLDDEVVDLLRTAP